MTGTPGYSNAAPMTHQGSGPEATAPEAREVASLPEQTTKLWSGARRVPIGHGSDPPMLDSRRRFTAPRTVLERPQNRRMCTMPLTVWSR
jgi:hypothetical protein